jgi:hypothetical protein
MPSARFEIAIPEIELLQAYALDRSHQDRHFCILRTHTHTHTHIYIYK